MLNGKSILITGGTGSLGKKLTKVILGRFKPSKLIIFSRDELKQFEMSQIFPETEFPCIRYFIGDVRDEKRLDEAFREVDYIIHAAALKQVPACEYNPFEAVKTNVLGAQNIIRAAIRQKVRRVVALSTDKAANPINLYGATKLCSDKLFVAGNSMSGDVGTRFSVVRYGNVVGSRGSVIPFFLRKRKEGVLPITDMRMTRFWITLEQGVELVLKCLTGMEGGGIWVPKIPSMRISDLAKVIDPNCKQEEVGIRPGEKLHEVMISIDDGRQTIEFDDHYIIAPLLPSWSDIPIQGGVPCDADFYFGSDNNKQWLNEEELGKMIADLELPEAKQWARERGLI